MKWMLFAASAAIAAGLWLPGPVTMSYAAQPAAPAETAAPLPATGEDKITFDQYREWRLRFIERRQTQLAAQLAAAELQPRQRARLDQTKAYYDGDIALDIPTIPDMIWLVKEIGHGKPRSQPS